MKNLRELRMKPGADMRRQWGAVWAAASTALSACLYLLDFATTMSALRTYYLYQYRCPHAAPSSPLLLHDPICHAIRSGHSLHTFAVEFWTCFCFLALSHLIYAFLFWFSLDPRLHPLRLAYFMPLIHLYRLLNLLCHPFRRERLEELQKRQRESSSLYNALGASVESAPQFIIQFFIALNLGEYVKGSSDPNLQAQRIPTNLIVSLVASMMSGCYTASMAIFFLIEERVPLAKRAFVAIVVACQTFVAKLAVAMCAAALSQFSEPHFSMPLLIYIAIGMMISWGFIGLLLQDHYCGCQGKNRCLGVAHSFGLALMTRIVGPFYVIVKLGKSSRCLIVGSLLHVLKELIGLALVFLWPHHMNDWKLPCYPLQITDIGEEENKFLTCKLFLGTILPSHFVLILTTSLLVWVDIKCGKDANDIEKKSIDTVCNTHNNATSSDISTLASFCVDFKAETSHQTSTSSSFKLYLVVITILFIQKVQKKYVLKSQATTSTY